MDPSDDIFSVEAIQKKFNIISACIDDLTDHDVSVIESYTLPHDITPKEFEEGLQHYIDKIYTPKHLATGIVSIFEVKDL